MILERILVGYRITFPPKCKSKQKDINTITYLFRVSLFRGEFRGYFTLYSGRRIFDRWSSAMQMAAIGRTIYFFSASKWKEEGEPDHQFMFAGRLATTTTNASAAGEYKGRVLIVTFFSAKRLDPLYDFSTHTHTHKKRSKSPDQQSNG